ncbi:MAG: serine/threonine-protein kinase [Myxococcaceae bacterium]
MSDGDEFPTERSSPVKSLVGMTLGDYRVTGRLGEGAMGEVFSGEQPLIGKKVAIKVLKPEVAADPSNVQRMLDEARTVNAIHHPNIVDIFTFGTLPDGRPYLVMDWMEGEPLDKLLDKRGALGTLDTIEIMSGVCFGLAAAHAHHIVHRDLKPANVFVSRDPSTRAWSVKLLDFGMAKNVTANNSRTQSNAVVGTPDYIAPEQARSTGVSAKTDLYALGVMGFEMATGQLPFTAPSLIELMMMHVQKPAPRVSSKLDDVNPAFDELVAQLLQKNPADRPRSADEVRSLLEQIRTELRESETNVGVVRRAAAETVPVFGAPRPSPRARAAQVTVPVETEPNPPIQRTATGENTVPLAAPRSSRRPLLVAIPVLLAAAGAALWAFTREPALEPNPAPVVSAPVRDTADDISPPAEKAAAPADELAIPVRTEGVRRDPLPSRRTARVNQLRARLKQEIADAKRRANSDAVTPLLDKKQHDLELRLGRAQTEGELEGLASDIDGIARAYR